MSKSFLENISVSHLKCSQSISMSSLRWIISRASHSTWLKGSQSKYWYHSTFLMKTTLSTAILSQRIFCLERLTSLVSRSLILVVDALKPRRFILTSNPDSIGLPKLSWAFPIVLLLICGALDVFFMNFTLAIHSSQVRMRKIIWLLWWKLRAFLQDLFSSNLQEERFSLTTTITQWLLPIHVAR